MGIFRYDTKYAAPTKEQRARYMTGDYEEHTFSDGKIVLIVYAGAAYLKDDIDGIRILFTGPQDMQKIYDEVRRLVDYHGQKEDFHDQFSTGGKGPEPE